MVAGGLMRSPEDYIGNSTDTWLSQCTNVCKYQTYLKAMFRMSSMCSNASSKTWTPLLNCFINKVLIFAIRSLYPLPWFISMVPSVSIFCNNLFKCLRLVWKFCHEFLAPYPFSCLNTYIKTRSFTENTMFTVYMIASKRHWVTAVCCTGNQNILSSIFKDW